jgi:hypothetical protein
MTTLLFRPPSNDCSRQGVHRLLLRGILQVKKGRMKVPARSMTRKEFGKHINNAQRALAKLGLDADRVQAKLFWSWDNASVNWTLADMVENDWDPTCRLPLSRYSPDMHKVIEHCMAHIKRELRRFARQCPELCTPAMLQKKAEQAFFSIDPDSIRRDVESLETTYKVIAGTEKETVTDRSGKVWHCTAGDWAPVGLR